MVLVHEMGHVERRDNCMQMVATIAHGLYWLNPAVHWAFGRLRLERERSCDDAVLAAGFDPAEYAAHLVSVVRRTAGPCEQASTPFSGREQLRLRVRSILHDSVRRRRLLPARLYFAMAGSALLALGLAMSGPAPAVGSARPETTPAPAMLLAVDARAASRDMGAALALPARGASSFAPASSVVAPPREPAFDPPGTADRAGRAGGPELPDREWRGRGRSDDERRRWERRQGGDDDPRDRRGHRFRGRDRESRDGQES